MEAKEITQIRLDIGLLDKNICFAYFCDDKFLGWYSDTFGTVTKADPKLYTNKESQIETITKNFRWKLSPNKHNASPNPIWDKYKKIELRIVECPIYDGPNPSWDKEAYNAAMSEYKKQVLAAGQFYDEYKREHPEPKHNNWIYADYHKVVEWARIEPTKFTDIIIGKCTAEVYTSESENSVTLLEAGKLASYPGKTDDYVLVRTIVGTDWNDVARQHHELMGWEPYKPFDD